MARAGWPVKTAVRKFRAEFEEYIKAGKKALPLVALIGVGILMATSRTKMKDPPSGPGGAGPGPGPRA